mmetsp:Transcript_8232/g.20248  ORF Transcript_8232/g.20248 Transcript_8232/m.20248 type:complete len:429 (+) Transcript_8232:170-1456(+)
MEINETAAGKSQSRPVCRVAIIGAQRQRVAKVTSLLHADDSFRYVTTSALLSSQLLAKETALTESLPKEVPSRVDIEYLPCVATFDSYEDEHGAAVRYLVKLEYHGPNGMLIKGKSLAPFFDDIEPTGNRDDNAEGNPFPSIAATAIGCGIDAEEDVGKIQNILETLSSCCEAQTQISSEQSDDNHRKIGMSIECIKPNAEYSSMKEENEAFRELDSEMKEKVLANGTIGPSKMAKFVYNVGKEVIRQRWNKELTEYEQSRIAEVQQTISPTVEETAQSEMQSTPSPHNPTPEKTRYACKRCRTILFGVEDLEDPPHTQSLHSFRKRGTKAGYGNVGSCQNHFIAEPLSWMNECGGLEGKLHCPKCNTKVGHYSWTGAQCSCGTWVTPAIMLPLSKVDEVKPVSQNVIAATGALFVDYHGLAMASSSG